MNGNRRGPQTSSNKARINDQIRVPSVRLIDAEGNQVGVVSIRDARQAADEAGLDLVEISPNAEPPVCRIMDHGKFIYEQSKKLREAKSKQVKTQVKEIKFRPTTDEGDYQVKLRNLIRFLEKGDKTKVTVRFRGREMAHKDIGVDVLNRLKVDLEPYAVVEQETRSEGRQITMVLSPKKR